MTAARYDVTGIGNAIVDIIGRCDDAYLDKIGAAKGSMRLVDAPTIRTIYDGMGPAIEISGGSAANTLAGVASFGGKAGFIGKVADDDFGRIFSHDIRSVGVTFNAPAVANGAPTSRSLILVTPDGERTMNTFLGISTDLDHGQLDSQLIADSAIVYLEGYLFDRDDAKAAFREALSVAKKNGRKVALTLSDGFCVDRHRAEFLALIRSGVDILFANEKEITSLYETEQFDVAADRVRHDTKLAVVTRSAKGSVVMADGTAVAVPAARIDEVVDTTGAGDLYASGFLYGYSRGLPHETSARLGGLAAAEVISHIGARPAISLKTLAQSQKLID
ncbi:MAG: adenosine kinase [Hyphomicrobium sp.]